jgi:hypothetical protein
VGWGPPPPWAIVRPTNTKAILAVSLLSIPVASLVFAVLARQEIRRTGEGGWGMATCGLWISVAVLACYVLFFGLYLVIALVAGFSALAELGTVSGSTSSGF